MKKISLIIISLFVIIFSAYGQDNTKFNLDPVATSYSFSQEVNTPGLNESVLYSRTSNWFSSNLKAQSFQTWNDNVTGKLIGKGQFELTGNDVIDNGNTISNFTFTFTLTVLMKDYKYKYILSNYKYSLANDNGLVIVEARSFNNSNCPVCYEKAWENIKKQVKEQTQALIISLNEALINPFEHEMSVN